MLRHYVFIVVLYSTCSTQYTKGWDTPSNRQYHIQTDEGPERYFRYQTDNGQYRKEKRLEDGTVVGTYAWIDDDGFLRQRDYVADDAGYRILKTKNLFVGRNIPVAQALKIAKKYPAGAGTLVESYQQPILNSNNNIPHNSVPASYISNAVKSNIQSPIIQATQGPYVDIVPNVINSTAAEIISSTTPIVEIIPNSIYPTTISPLLLPPKNNSFVSHLTENYISATPHADYSNPIQNPTYYRDNGPLISDSHSSPTLEYLPSSQQAYGKLTSTFKDSSQNSIEYNPHYISQTEKSYNFQNGPTYPLDQHGLPYVGNVRNKYNQQQEYDGVSVTNDGFRYYIPRAYHEEQTLPDDKRSGSFGYIDPFGIRRVIYYNTAPGSGFQHRKNNRYVGFDATPYDPRS